MASDVPVTAPYRDYYLTAPQRWQEIGTTAVARGFGYLDLETDDEILQEDGTSKLFIEWASLCPILHGLYRDYYLTAPERQ